MKLPTILANLHSSVLPSTADALEIIHQSRQLLYAESNLIQVQSPVTIVGDIHGQFYDLLNILTIAGDPSLNRFLFLGDYVDRGYNSVECILLLLVLKLQHPTNVSLLRGNHESFELTRTYGFKVECEKKYSTAVYYAFCELFTYIPICAVIDGAMFAVHGGIVPEILDIKEIDKFYRYEESLVHNMMWSDPMTESGFMKNPRGAGCLFGEDVANAFLAFNSLSIIVRSHQLVMEGYRYMFKKKLVTVWSAPNYCYKTENIACIMQVEKCDEYKFILFDKVDNQKNE